MINYP